MGIAGTRHLILTKKYTDETGDFHVMFLKWKLKK